MTDNTQKHIEEIKAWLKSDRDFDEGYELFVRFSHNKALAIQLARKRRLSKLVYELEKITKRAFLKESPVFPVKKVKMTVKRQRDNSEVKKLVEDAEKKLQYSADDIVDEKLDEMKADANDVVSDKLAELETAAYEVLLEKVEIISEGRKIKLKDLPEDLQKLWLENRDSTKVMRAIHEKMKLAKGDVERAGHRADLVKLDDKIAANWKVIDGWGKGGDEPESETGDPGPDPDPTEADPVTVAKEVMACRSYISRNMKKVNDLKGEKREKLLTKMAERLATLQKHNAEISDSTRDELVKFGLIV